MTYPHLFAGFPSLGFGTLGSFRLEGHQLNKKLSVAEAKKSLGKGKGTGKKGWFGSKARTSVALKLHGPKG
jgi:hypothetical protein